MKTYKSFGKNLIMVIVLADGSRKTLEFKRDIVSDNCVWGSSYSTDSNEIQKAIESHKYFGAKGKAVVWTDKKKKKTIDSEE